MTDARAPRFVPVDPLARLGPLMVAGRAVCARAGAGVSGDGLWREQGRADGGTLFLLVDVEGKGPATSPLREVLELALDDEATWDLPPGELLAELHSQAAVTWAESAKCFVAQAVLVLPDHGAFLVASAGVPYPFHAPAGRPWEEIATPTKSISWLGRPDIHDEGGPIFPPRRCPLRPGDDYLGCTDGITEAGRPATLGAAGVLGLLNGMGARPDPVECLDRVFALAAARDGPAWPGDDSTAVAWRWLEDGSQG